MKTPTLVARGQTALTIVIFKEANGAFNIVVHCHSAARYQEDSHTITMFAALQLAAWAFVVFLSSGKTPQT